LGDGRGKGEIEVSGSQVKGQPGLFASKKSLRREGMQASLERLRRRREDPESEGGFTLIELLIVIVILGILAAIVVFAVQNLSGQSAQASCGSDYKTVETAVEGYKAQIGVYPGGVITTGWTTTGLPAGTPAAAGVFAAGGPAGAAGTTLLLEPYTNPNATQTVGPWLKDWPSNPGHYSIGVDGAGAGTIQVYNGTGAAQAAGAAGCSTVS
jgi:prepilin-type N-terminal cleavage/methylation domain-containing protein